MVWGRKCLNKSVRVSSHLSVSSFFCVRVCSVGMWNLIWAGRWGWAQWVSFGELLRCVAAFRLRLFFFFLGKEIWPQQDLSLRFYFQKYVFGGMCADHFPASEVIMTSFQPVSHPNQLVSSISKNTSLHWQIFFPKKSRAATNFLYGLIRQLFSRFSY